MRGAKTTKPAGWDARERHNPPEPEGAGAVGRVTLLTDYDGLDKRRAVRAGRVFLQRRGVSAKEIRSLRFSAERRGDHLVVVVTGPGPLVGGVAKRCVLTVSYSYLSGVK